MLLFTGSEKFPYQLTPTPSNSACNPERQTNNHLLVSLFVIISHDLSCWQFYFYLLFLCNPKSQPIAGRNRHTSWVAKQWMLFVYLIERNMRWHLRSTKCDSSAQLIHWKDQFGYHFCFVASSRIGCHAVAPIPDLHRWCASRWKAIPVAVLGYFSEGIPTLIVGIATFVAWVARAPNYIPLPDTVKTRTSSSCRLGSSRSAE